MMTAEERAHIVSEIAQVQDSLTVATRILNIVPGYSTNPEEAWNYITDAFKEHGKVMNKLALFLDKDEARSV